MRIWLNHIVALMGLALWSCGALTSAAQAADRVALVIGNGAYQNANALPNPPRDAKAVATALTAIGFDVTQGQDLTRVDMERAVRTFLSKAANAKIALLFYAGHGMQVAGRNYLVPVDAKFESAADLNFEAVKLDDILDTFSDPMRANIVILDACRDNPLARSFAAKSRSVGVGSGLTTPSVGTGTLIAFSTAPDHVALDGDGANSPFTQGLIKYLAVPGLEVRQMLTRVRADVVESTHDKQIPWDNSSLLGDVYLNGAGAPAQPPLAPPQPQVSLPPQVAPQVVPQPPVQRPPEVAVIPRAPPPVAPAAKQYAYIVGLDPNGDNFLALRTEPSSRTGSRLMKMGPDTMFEILATQGEWDQIRLPTGEVGWAAARYIACCRQVGAAPVVASRSAGATSYSYVTGLNVNGDNFLALRSEPSGGDNVLKKMGPNTLLLAMERQGDWVHVRLPSGETGWAYYKFIACCRAAPN